MIRSLRSQSGLVSLLSAIFISILVMIIVLGMVAVQMREQRQATDIDQSVRAFYAAQAGLEQTFLDYKNDPQAVLASAGDDCQPKVPLGDEAEITCVLVQTGQNLATGELAVEESAQLDIAGQGFDRVVIRWGSPEDEITPNNNSNFPANWPDNWPAAFDLTAISYRASGIITLAGLGPAVSETQQADRIWIQSVVLRPHGTVGSNTQYPIATAPGGAQPSSSERLRTAHCANNNANALGGYRCQVTLTNFDPNRRYVLRFRPRFAGTRYSMDIQRGAGNSVPIPDQTVTFDVTARAGDVFRRIISKSPASGGRVFSGLDYVLFSDTDICKDITVNTSGVTAGNAPNLASC